MYGGQISNYFSQTYDTEIQYFLSYECGFCFVCLFPLEYGRSKANKEKNDKEVDTEKGTKGRKRKEERIINTKRKKIEEKMKETDHEINSNISIKVMNSKSS